MSTFTITSNPPFKSLNLASIEKKIRSQRNTCLKIAQGFPATVAVCRHYVFGRSSRSIYTAVNAGPSPWAEITMSTLENTNTWTWLRMHSWLTKYYGECFNIFPAQKVSMTRIQSIFLYFLYRHVLKVMLTVHKWESIYFVSLKN